MENCRRRQSSSTSVLLPTGSSGNGMTVQQELVPGRESCGRDIRITFTIQDTSPGPLANWGDTPESEIRNPKSPRVILVTASAVFFHNTRAPGLANSPGGKRL